MSTSLQRLTGAVLFLALMGCASTAQQLVQSAGGRDTILPSQAIVEGELKGRSLEVGRVYLALDTAKSHFLLPKDAYVRLMENQLAKAFKHAGLMQGTMPAYTVDVAIERMEFVKGAWLFAKPSILRARMEIHRPDNTLVLRGSFECSDLATVPVLIGGILTPVATPHSTETMAHAKLIPAMASLLATVAVGLQEGKTLEAMTIFPDDFRPPPADYVLQHTKLGLTPLTKVETEELTGLKLPEEDH
jgi:hypothetical protein